MKYPLVPLCIAFSSGILLAQYIGIPFSAVFLTAFLFLVLSIVFIKRNARFNIFLLLSFLLLGALVLKNSLVLPECHISKFASHKSEDAVLTGTIDDDPAYLKGGISFVLKAQELKIGARTHNVCGRVLVKVRSREESRDPYFYGDRLSLGGRLFKPFSFSREFDYERYLRHRNIYSVFSVKKDNTIKRLSENLGNLLKYSAFKIRHKTRKIFDDHLSQSGSGIMGAIILGQRQTLPNDIKETLRFAGTVHIIAISGLHLGIVALMTLLVLKIMGIPRKPRYIITVIILIVYCVLTGSRIPVIRAAIIAVILLTGYLFERDFNISSSLSLAALIILIANPHQLFEIGFQLSFLSVIFIGWLTPKIRSLFPAKLYEARYLRFLILDFSVSMAVWIGLTPIIAYYFQLVSPIAIIANMIIVPFMPFIVASGFCLAVVGIIAPFISFIFSQACELFIIILLKINLLLVSIPGAYFKIQKISVVHIASYYCLILLSYYLTKFMRVRITRAESTEKVF